MGIPQTNGVCDYLGEDKKCTIYENRPLLCRSGWVHKTMFKSMTDEEYETISREACFQLGANLGGEEDEEDFYTHIG